MQKPPRERISAGATLHGVMRGERDYLSKGSVLGAAS